MNSILWICQGFIALTFLYSGICKSTLPQKKLIDRGQTGVEGLSYPTIRFIGLSEILGAIGLIVPALTGITPALSPIAALCFAFIMVLATPIHYKRKELKSVAFNILLLLLCLFVAFGRFREL